MVGTTLSADEPFSSANEEKRSSCLSVVTVPYEEPSLSRLESTLDSINAEIRVSVLALDSSQRVSEPTTYVFNAPQFADSLSDM